MRIFRYPSQFITAISLLLLPLFFQNCSTPTEFKSIEQSTPDTLPSVPPPVRNVGAPPADAVTTEPPAAVKIAYIEAHEQWAPCLRFASDNMIVSESLETLNLQMRAHNTCGYSLQPIEYYDHVGVYTVGGYFQNYANGLPAGGAIFIRNTPLAPGEVLIQNWELRPDQAVPGSSKFTPGQSIMVRFELNGIYEAGSQMDSIEFLYTVPGTAEAGAGTGVTATPTPTPTATTARSSWTTNTTTATPTPTLEITPPSTSFTCVKTKNQQCGSACCGGAAKVISSSAYSCVCKY